MGEIAEHILHVDMDAFFVEVERLADRSLVGVPVVVGGLGGRGVVASASYEARSAGVRSAMPIAEARRRVPNGRFVPPDHEAYRAVSSRVFVILESFTPIVEPVSIDEAFLEIGGLGLHHASAAEVASEIRAALRSELKLPASAGAATTKLIAKLASEQAKPDGQLTVTAGAEIEFLRPLEVRSLWGVGEATFASLEGLGVTTVGELAELSESMVRRRLGEAVGAHLWALAHNIDDRVVTPGGDAKSISTEETFDSDLVSDERIDDELFRLAAALSDRLRLAGKAARTISVKVRFDDYSTVTRSHSFDGALDLTVDVYDAATGLVRRAGADGRPVRLLGITGTALVATDEPRQLGLGDGSRQALASVSDDVRRRFGAEAVRPARLVPLPDPEHK